MGTYLMTGIIQTIQVDKDEMHKISLKQVITELSKQVNLSKFQFTEDQQGYTWEIKDPHLEGLVPFLTAQCDMYGSEHYDRSYFSKIEKMTGEQIKKFVVEESRPEFQLVKNLIDIVEIDYVSRATVYYKAICYFIDGKIIMECYGNILRYFEQLIRLQQEKYPIADCVKVMITA